jgi:hypothetical protein
MRPRIRKTKESLVNSVSINTRFSEDAYNFLRDQAYVQRKSMNLIVEECVQRYKKMLTSTDSVVL